MNGGTPLPRIEVIVVNYHTPGLTAQAVDSALASRGVQTHVTLIDNEGDGRWARERWGEEPRVSVSANAENLGFGAACNQGLEAARAAGAECACLLNSDATLDPDALARLAPAAERAGAAAPRILTSDGRIYSAGGVIDLFRARCFNRGWGEIDHGQHAQSRRLRFASACVLMLSRRALDAGAAFDGAYFLYYEDADLCLALERAGLEVAYVPDATAQHREGASGGEGTSPLRQYYNTRNRWFLLHRWGTPAERLAGGVYWLMAMAAKSAALVLRGQRHAARAMLRGAMDALAGRRGRREGL